MSDENIPSPRTRVLVRDDTPLAEADYPFFMPLIDETYSLNIALVEDPNKQQTPYYNIDFTIQAELTEEEDDDPLLEFTRFNDANEKLPPGTHLLKWVSPQEGLLFSDGQKLSVQTAVDKGIVVGDSTGCGWVPPPAGNASFGWKGGASWSWFQAKEGAALAVLTVPPSGGFGPAVYRVISAADDGSWTATGPELPVIVPKI